jgi:anti-anti-sigma factor
LKQGFSFRAGREEGILLFRLIGEITAGSEEEFKGMLSPDEESGAVVLDFSAVDYINSAGLALLIGLVRRCREAGLTMGAVKLSDHYRKIFQMIGLSDYITVFDSEDAARRVLGAVDIAGGSEQK